MALTGQLTVPTAGTAVTFADQPIFGPVIVKALPANTGVIYVGGSGVLSSTGFPLSAKETLAIDRVGNMTELWINATVNGEGIAWFSSLL